MTMMKQTSSVAFNMSMPEINIEFELLVIFIPRKIDIVDPLLERDSRK